MLPFHIRYNNTHAYLGSTRPKILCFQISWYNYGYSNIERLVSNDNKTRISILVTHLHKQLYDIFVEQCLTLTHISNMWDSTVLRVLKPYAMKICMPGLIHVVVTKIQISYFI